jgi:hypothetical protein
VIRSESEQAFHAYNWLRTHGYSRKEALAHLAEQGYRMVPVSAIDGELDGHHSYTNPPPKAHALADPLERAPQAFIIAKPDGGTPYTVVEQQLQHDAGPWLEVGRRYPSESWPTTPVAAVRWPGLVGRKRAARRRRWLWIFPLPRPVLYWFNVIMLIMWTPASAVLAIGSSSPTPITVGGAAELLVSCAASLLLAWMIANLGKRA